MQIVLPTWPMIRPFSAELILIGTIVAVLIAPFFVPKKSNGPCGVISLIGCIAAMLSLIGNHTVGQSFSGLLLSDATAVFWKAILLLFVAGVIVLWFGSTAKTLRQGDGPEFFALLLGATLGMCLMVSTSNWLMLVISTELASLASYVLAGFRKTHRLGAEASLKYVLFGAACNAVMVYGLSLLYGTSGSLQLDQVVGGVLPAVGYFCILAGIGFKIAAVPFHFWCPDVFEGASIDVTAFLSVASKGAALLALLRIAASVPGMGNGCVIVLGVLGALTATVGNTAAFSQTNIKRLLGYSSIAHAGYILCAVAAAIGRPSGDVAQAVLCYLLVYLFMNLGAFAVTAAVGETIDTFAGLGKRSPLLALAMTGCLVSLIGLPPLAGFNAKLNIMVLLGSIGGQESVWWWALVTAIGINTVLSMYFYLRIVKAMYFDASDQPTPAGSILTTWLASACAVILLAIFIGFGPVSRLTADYGHLLGSAVEPGTPSIAGGQLPPASRRLLVAGY